MIKRSSLTLFLAMAGVILFAQHHSEHHAKKHHVALFGGSAVNFDHGSTDFSLGFDYEYRLSGLIGVGFLGEVVFAASEEMIAGVPFFIHPVKGLKGTFGPIVLFTEAHHEADPQQDLHQEDPHLEDPLHEDPHSEPGSKEAHVGARIGLSYDFHIGRFSVGPVVSFDITHTKALVTGVTVGLGF